MRVVEIETFKEQSEVLGSLNGHYPLFEFEEGYYLLFQELKVKDCLWGFKTESLTSTNLTNNGNLVGKFAFKSLRDNINWKASGHRLECPISAACYTTDQKTYIFGGFSDSWSPLDQLICISKRTETSKNDWPIFEIRLVSPRKRKALWTPQDKTMSLQRQRVNSYITSFDDKLIILGGLTFTDSDFAMNTDFKDVLLYDIIADSWTTQPCPGLPKLCSALGKSFCNEQNVVITLVGGSSIKDNVHDPQRLVHRIIGSKDEEGTLTFQHCLLYQIDHPKTFAQFASPEFFGHIHWIDSKRLFSLAGGSTKSVALDIEDPLYFITIKPAPPCFSNDEDDSEEAKELKRSVIHAIVLTKKHIYAFLDTNRIERMDTD